MFNTSPRKQTTHNIAVEKRGYERPLATARRTTSVVATPQRLVGKSHDTDTACICEYQYSCYDSYVEQDCAKPQLKTPNDAYKSSLLVDSDNKNIVDTYEDTNKPSLKARTPCSPRKLYMLTTVRVIHSKKANEEHGCWITSILIFGIFSFIL